MFTAAVRAVLAWARAASKIRNPSRSPSERGWASLPAARASRAARSASAGSDLPPGRLLARAGRPASTTVCPLACKTRSNPRPCERVPSTAHASRGPGAWLRAQASSIAQPRGSAGTVIVATCRPR